MSAAVREKIRAIYPLGSVQRALLFTHLSSPSADPGVIQTRCRVSGPLDVDCFLRAWRVVASRHEALSASVHWEKVSKPVWVVHAEVSPPSAYLDWRHETNPEEAIEHLLREDLRRGIDLRQPFAGRITLVHQADEEYLLLWTSHHIMLDGWSSNLVLQDVMATYGALIQGTEIRSRPALTYRDYLRWENGQDREASFAFWAERMRQLDRPTLVPSTEGPQSEVSLTLPREISDRLSEFCRGRGLTPNTVLQGLWAVVLGRFMEVDAVCFGVTVSGRHGEVENMDGAVGMFARVLPRIVNLGANGRYFTQLQQNGSREVGHQAISMEDIADWSPGGEGQLPFNSLFAVQNHPRSDLRGGGVRITEVIGDLTSNYPLTCIVVPHGSWKLYVRYKPGIQSDQAKWMITSLSQLIERVARNGTAEPVALAAGLEPVPAARDTRNESVAEFAAPANITQMRLVAIWEKLLPVENIGIDDNFFSIGGTSIAAVRMFARFESETGKNIEPAKLMAYPTIRGLSGFIDSGGERAAWNNLVPQRASGDLPPAFCFHAGLGQVFMYQPLTRHLHPDRPVYALQPNGLNGVDRPHESIESMAAHYLREMEEVATKDPLVLISYCYSTPICIEIARLLLEAGRPAPVMVAIDMSPRPDRPPFQRKSRTPHPPGSLRWYVGQLRRGRFRVAVDEAIARYIPPGKLSAEQRTRIRATRLKRSLVRAYRKYRWGYYGHPALLIRSSSYAEREHQADLLRNWREYTNDHLTVKDVAADHRTILQDPSSAATVATLIEEYISGRG